MRYVFGFVVIWLLLSIMQRLDAIEDRLPPAPDRIPYSNPEQP